MSEHPILFSAPMVRAILDGRKTQTRRVVKGDYQHEHTHPEDGLTTIRHSGKFWCYDDFIHERCPYGLTGDRLWVRETWKPEELDAQGHDEIGDALGDYPDGTDGIRYQADDAFIPIENSAEASDRWHSLLRPRETWPELRPKVWRPSIHMPRWASRITLEVTAVRVERLHDISRDDAQAEGFVDKEPAIPIDPRDWFRVLWDSINAKRGHGWDTNPWVWVVEFKRVMP